MEDLIFNELSVEPCPANFYELNQRITELISLVKEAQKFGFKKLRFTQEWHNYKLLEENFSFKDYIQDKRVNPTNRNFLLSIRRYPFIDDEDSDVFNQYSENQFSFQKNHKKLPCDGLATAYLYNTLAVSFLSESIWENIKITILVQGENTETKAQVFHVSKATCLTTENELIQWLEKNNQQAINSEADLKQLYPDYEFTPQAVKDLFFWKAKNQKIYDRLHLLLRDIELNPFIGGLGKTEILGGDLSGQISKRLDEKNRITYAVKDNIITIYRCRGHY